MADWFRQMAVSGSNPSNIVPHWLTSEKNKYGWETDI